MARVSVVTPCLNAAAFVEEAVGSVFGQRVAEIELIVVDDGSTDGSRAILETLQARYGHRLRLLRTDRAGPYPARNLALRHASGEYVAFLDADDTWEPDFLHSMLGALESSGADLAYCGWQNVGAGAPGAMPYIPPAYGDGDPVEEFLHRCPWPIHAALTRRSVIDRLGGFSERMFSSMDYDLWIRMLAVTRRMVRVPRVLAYYRWHGSGQISATRWRQVLDAWQVRRDFVAANPALVAHLDRKRIAQLVDGVLLDAAYQAFWRRDLETAQRLFRKALGTGAWRPKDLKYLGASLLPAGAFRALAGTAEERRRA